MKILFLFILLLLTVSASAQTSGCIAQARQLSEAGTGAEMSARSDWEKHKNYPPDWSWATWPERAGMVFAWIAAGTVGLGMFLGALLVLGMMIDTADQRREEHDRCMKHATNGYEIERCR